MTAHAPIAARFLGRSVLRKEDQRLLTGHGQYVDDVTVPGMLHAAFLRSDLARADITRLDATAARERAGVVAVFTWEDFDGRFGEAYHEMMGEALVVPSPLAIGDVRCELIEVEFEPRQAVVDYLSASADTENIVHAAWGLQSNAMVAVPFTPLSGDLAETFANASHVIECTVEQNRYLPLPMETRGMLASYSPGREELEPVSATQWVHGTRNFFARYLQMPEGKIHVTARDVGGGFGQKMFVYREECAVVLASRRLGRPVKWIEDRRENLIAAGHSRNEIGKVRLAVDEDSVIQASSTSLIGSSASS